MTVDRALQLFMIGYQNSSKINKWPDCYLSILSSQSQITRIMMLTSKELGNILQAEVEQGYDPLKIARRAFQFYQKFSLDIAPELDEKLLGKIRTSSF